LDDTNCNAQNRWRYVDAHFHTGAVTMSRSLLPTKAANTLIMGECCSLALGLYEMQHPNSWCVADAPLTLCWCSVDALLMLCWHWSLCVATSTLTLVPSKEANTSIMGKSRSTALGLYKMQHPQLLTLCWCSFSEWRCDYVAFCFANKGCQYVDYG